MKIQLDNLILNDGEVGEYALTCQILDGINDFARAFAQEKIDEYASAKKFIVPSTVQINVQVNEVKRTFFPNATFSYYRFYWETPNNPGRVERGKEKIEIFPLSQKEKEMEEFVERNSYKSPTGWMQIHNCIKHPEEASFSRGGKAEVNLDIQVSWKTASSKKEFNSKGSMKCPYYGLKVRIPSYL